MLIMFGKAAEMAIFIGVRPVRQLSLNYIVKPTKRQLPTIFESTIKKIKNGSPSTANVIVPIGIVT